MLGGILLTAGAVYGGAVAILYGLQRRLMYPGSEPSVAPEAVGLRGVEPVRLEMADGVRLLAWWMPPADGKPIVLYWHGNAGPLHCRTHKFAAFGAQGYGMLMPAYRGYSGNSGKPSQPALLADAQVAVDWLARRSTAAPIYYGESLGSGIALAMASRNKLRAIVLEGAFDSAASVAQKRYPCFPAARLIRDPWDNLAVAGACPAPVLMLHGSLDRVVPIKHAERLFKALPEPKHFARFDQAGHTDLFEHGGDKVVFKWLTSPTQPALPLRSETPGQRTQSCRGRI